MTSELEIKEVVFNGDTLIAVQGDNNKIYAGVSNICNCIGFNKNQKDRQIKNIQVDEILSRGCVKFDAGVFDANNSTLAIEIDFIPLWLAKISITPQMKKHESEIVRKLVDYQLKAQKVLADAFIKKEGQEVSPYLTMLKNLNENQALLLAEQRKTNEKIENHIEMYGRDKKDLANLKAAFEREIRNIKEQMRENQNINIVFDKPLVVKRNYALNEARKTIIDKYSVSTHSADLVQKFADRIDKIVDYIISSKWTITKIKREAERTDAGISGDEAFIHDICLSCITHYFGSKAS